MAKQIENEKYRIAVETEKRVIVAVKNDWQAKLTELCDWGDEANRFLQGFDTQNKVGLNPYRFFQVNAIEVPRNILVRLKTFFPQIEV